MYPVLVPSLNVLVGMAAIDEQIADDTRQEGCPHCGGPLHRATWQRQPRGAGDDLPKSCTTRWGLCCAWCRKRVLPDSVLFCGRHVYLKAVMLLVVAARQRQLSPTSMGKLRALFGVSAETIRRWLDVFLERLPEASAWMRRRGRISPRVRDSEVPAALLDWLLEILGDVDKALVQAATLVPGL